MPLKFDKTTEDRRGKIIWLSSELTKINIVEIRSGFARGGHYHNSKTEKFLVAKGEARFDFRHMLTNESYEITTSNKELKIVETAPGWAHNITNIGKEEMVVILWSNEIFDPDNPDTITSKV